jgi:AcrR family transcriptional regulator
MAPGPGSLRIEPGGATRSSALEAAGELLASEGLVGLTMAAVATRARVDKSTMRRWWPTEDALALDVLRHEWFVLASRIRRRSCMLGL